MQILFIPTSLATCHMWYNKLYRKGQKTSHTALHYTSEPQNVKVTHHSLWCFIITSVLTTSNTNLSCFLYFRGSTLYKEKKRSATNPATLTLQQRQLKQLSQEPYLIFQRNKYGWIQLHIYTIILGVGFCKSRLIGLRDGV